MAILSNKPTSVHSLFVASYQRPYPNSRNIGAFLLVCRTNRGEGVRCCSEAFTVAINDGLRLTSEIVYHL